MFEGWLVREAYTFGMPRPGDAAFARTFDGMCLGLEVCHVFSVQPLDDPAMEKISKQWNLDVFQGALNFKIEAPSRSKNSITQFDQVFGGYFLMIVA